MENEHDKTKLHEKTTHKSSRENDLGLIYTMVVLEEHVFSPQISVSEELV